MSLTAVLLHVLARVVHQSHNVMVVEGIEGLPAGAPDTDQPRRTQQPELVRGGGFTEPNEPGEIADTALAVRQGIYNADASRVGEQSEDVCNRVQRAAAKQPGTHVR